MLFLILRTSKCATTVHKFLRIETTLHFPSRVLAILSGFLCLVCLVIFIHTLVDKCLKKPFQENTSKNTPQDENDNISVSHIYTEHIIGPFGVTLVLLMIFLHFKIDRFVVPFRFHLLLLDLIPLLRGSAIITSYIYYKNPHLRTFVKNIIYRKQEPNNLVLEIM